MTTNIVINGACGRMGREIALAAFADPSVVVSGCLDSPQHPLLGEDIGVLCGLGPRGINVTADPLLLPLKKSVLIDFSAPVSTLALAQLLQEHGGRLVVGTTGLGSGEIGELRKASGVLPILFSPNMSLGVNLLFHLTKIVARRLSGSFDMEIIEAHHRHKKDSPSGTARRLGEIAAESLGLSYDEAVVNGRNGIVGERTRHEVGMHAVRGGDIVGDHTVLFAGEGEHLELRHVAHSRATFARGAVFAAKWLSTKGPGLYSMSDALDI